MRKIYFLFASTILINSFSVSQPNYNYNHGKYHRVFERINFADENLSSSHVEPNLTHYLSKSINSYFITINDQLIIDQKLVSQSGQKQEQNRNDEPEKSEIKSWNNAIYFISFISLTFLHSHWELGGAVGFNYERMIHRWDAVGLFAIIGYQRWADILNAESGKRFSLQPGIIIGKLATRFDATLGATAVK